MKRKKIFWIWVFNSWTCQILSKNQVQVHQQIAECNRLDQGWRTYLLSRDAWIAHYRWWAAKAIIFVLNFYLYPTVRRVTSLDLLSKHLRIMQLRFDAMLYSYLSNENSDAGHIKRSRGPQVPHPWLDQSSQITRFLKTWSTSGKTKLSSDNVTITTRKKCLVFVNN